MWSKIQRPDKMTRHKWIACKILPHNKWKLNKYELMRKSHEHEISCKCCTFLALKQLMSRLSAFTLRQGMVTLLNAWFLAYNWKYVHLTLASPSSAPLSPNQLVQDEENNQDGEISVPSGLDSRCSHHYWCRRPRRGNCVLEVSNLFLQPGLWKHILSQHPASPHQGPVWRPLCMGPCHRLENWDGGG